MIELRNPIDPRTKQTMATSKKEASQAGKDLRDPKTPKKDRGPIASALAQAKRRASKEGGKK